jgi:hypothetical protein
MTGDGKTGVFWVSAYFRGRLIGRILTLSPNSAAVTIIHAADSNGASRCKHCRI